MAHAGTTSPAYQTLPVRAGTLGFDLLKFGVEVGFESLERARSFASLARRAGRMRRSPAEPRSSFSSIHARSSAIRSWNRSFRYVKMRSRARRSARRSSISPCSSERASSSSAVNEIGSRRWRDSPTTAGSGLAATPGSGSPSIRPRAHLQVRTDEVAYHAPERCRLLALQLVDDLDFRLTELKVVGPADTRRRRLAFQRQTEDLVHERMPHSEEVEIFHGQRITRVERASHRALLGVQPARRAWVRSSARPRLRCAV